MEYCEYRLNMMIRSNTRPILDVMVSKPISVNGEKPALLYVDAIMNGPLCI